LRTKKKKRMSKFHSLLFYLATVCAKNVFMQNEETIDEVREYTKKLAAEYLERGDATGWFDALYAEAAGDNEKIPWADLEPNKYLRQWAEKVDLKGNGRTALVVGCGLGDDARFLEDSGFKVTAFDISETAINWAKRLHKDTKIDFQTADLFQTPDDWQKAFDFVLEVYTIQPLPLEMRSQVIDKIADFVADGGELVVVTRGREDDEEPLELPWALSRKDLSCFEKNGLTQTDFTILFADDEEEPIPRFVVKYKRN
jgi:SAM-dependent methyltransferase